MNARGLQSLTFVVPTYGAEDLFEHNFLASPCLQRLHHYQFLIQRDYSSAAKAYNNAIDQACNDLIVFAHQDVIFPEGWLGDLENALEYLNESDPNWGVLGCYGVTSDGAARGCIYSPGPGIVGMALMKPAKVQTLDEIVLIIRKSSGLRFDPDLPSFHLYGTDICMRAAQIGLNSYSIPAYCIHNAHHYMILPPEFYQCYRYIQRVWRDALPIQTSCLKVSRSNTPKHIRQLREMFLRVRGKGFIASRSDDVTQLLFDATAQWLRHQSV